MFTYDLDNADPTIVDISKIRFEIGDTDATSGVKPNGSPFSDEEIHVWYDREGGVLGSAAAACDTLARMWARAATISIGGRSESLSDISKQYAALANDLRARGGDTGGVAALRLGWIEPVCTAGYVEGDGCL